jgi:hypothetical protein
MEAFHILVTYPCREDVLVASNQLLQDDDDPCGSSCRLYATCEAEGKESPWEVAVEVQNNKELAECDDAEGGAFCCQHQDGQQEEDSCSPVVQVAD